MKIDWKQKFSSRKFWAAAGAWATSILTAFGATENTVARVVILLGGLGALCVYMLAESKADAARVAPPGENAAE